MSATSQNHEPRHLPGISAEVLEAAEASLSRRKRRLAQRAAEEFLQESPSRALERFQKRGQSILGMYKEERE